MTIYGWRADGSREAVVKLCDQRAERAETMMNVHERRAQWLFTSGERQRAGERWWRFVLGERSEPKRWSIVASGERQRAAKRWWTNVAVMKTYGWQVETSRETLFKICERRAERAETVINIIERRSALSENGNEGVWPAIQWIMMIWTHGGLSA